MKKSVSLLVGICTLALVLASCASAPTFNYRSDPATRELLSKSPPAMPAARFMSISDLHLYDGANLGQEGAAFQDYLDRDRKLLRESPEILARALQSVIAEHPDFLLVSGDLTKDGERVNHELAAKMLGTVEAAGIKVFVINGNHDINNPDAMRFSGEKTEAVPGIDPAGFAAIYADFGYAEAIDRDPASLSYVVEPVPGLWLLAIDSCRYDTNYADGEPVIPGRLDGHRLAWVEKTLLRARAEGKAVIGMQHHGMVEHYPSQEQYYGEYLLDDHDAIGRMYADLGLRVVFTGHFHANDVALRDYGQAGRLYDVETGSLVTWPSPVRHMSGDANGTLHISTSHIDWPEYSEDFMLRGIETIAISAMEKLGVPADEARRLAPQISMAFGAHYQGDEQFAGTVMLTTKGLSFMGGLVMENRRNLITGLWQDTAPADNKLSIATDGSWQGE